MKNEFLHELFVDVLKDLYSAEKQLVAKGLPEMISASTNPKMKAAFEEHLTQTEEHVRRLEEIAKVVSNVALNGKKCVGMEGLIKEGEELVKTELDEVSMDMGLNTGAMKVEYYEIVEYNTAVSLAHLMGHHEAGEILEKTLNEEIDTNQKLEELAIDMIDSLADDDMEDEGIDDDEEMEEDEE
jgi:ferritin-like metal-binding protein YciE